MSKRLLIKENIFVFSSLKKVALRQTRQENADGVLYENRREIAFAYLRRNEPVYSQGEFLINPKFKRNIDYSHLHRMCFERKNEHFKRRNESIDAQ